MPQSIFIPLLISLWTVAVILWALVWATGRRRARGEGMGEQGRDCGLTSSALGKPIYEQTRLGENGSRATSIGFMWEEQLKDHGRLLETQFALNTERNRVTALSRELKATQDALADTVRRLEALEASQRQSRRRSLLR
ncbi:hypothetical protein AB2L27_19785 [Kineococcus sp. LSe6-4]|uniref:DUF2746 domain-containing protein n=1 Tax=Kineococcus halophytocola TaxID=3234027 RepID=A0ABV4H9B4_9ACTN